MMNVIFSIVKVLFTAWLLVSPLVCLYWVFNPPDYFWAAHRRISTMIYVGGFLSFFFIIARGFDLYLWFIPDSWVYETDEGEIQLVRTTIACLMGLVVTISLAIALEKVCHQKHREQTESTIRWFILEKKRRLDSAVSENERDIILAEFRKEKVNLEKLNKLKPFQERNLRILCGLLDEWREQRKAERKAEREARRET